MLKINSLSKHFDTVHALDGLSLSVPAGEFVTIIGASGCGKSTLFRILAGLVESDSGEIFLHDKAEPHKESRRGKFGYMPQRDALLPWRTVLQNVVLGAEVDGTLTDQTLLEAQSLLPLFGLDGFGDAWPNTLSGGMRQRAALLRTFLTGRDILLLDEPFGALDAITRQELQIWLAGIQDQFKKTILFITHDVDEALLLGDRVIVLAPRPGRMVLDMPVELDKNDEELLLSADFLRHKQTLLRNLRS